MKVKTLKDAAVEGKKVLLRTGFDVPIENGKIVDDSRIISGLPTIKYLLEKNCEITVINHIGRPNGKVDVALSNKLVEKRTRDLIGAEESTDIHTSLQEQGKAVAYVLKNIPQPQAGLVSDVTSEPRGEVEENFTAGKNYSVSERYIRPLKGTIHFLENIRFDPREQEGSDELAGELARGQDIFVQDAFSDCHRNHTSMVNITKFLPSYAGLLMEKEYINLSKLIDNPAKPFVVIIGGKKVETKLPIIERIKPLVDFILIGGATANEAKAQHLFQNDDKVILPVDGVADENNNIRDIGSQTIELFKQKLESAKTVFWNGNLGVTEDARYRAGSRQIGSILTGLDAFVVAGGGDTDELIRDLGIESKFDYISTAGGASLVFLSGQKMPGLEPLII